MSQKSGPGKLSSEQVVEDIRRAMRKHHEAEEKSASWRAATSTEVSDLRREARALEEFVAEQALELRLLKKA